MDFLFLVIYVFLASIFIYILRRQNIKNRFVGAYSGFVFGYIFFYLLIPILVKLNLHNMQSRYRYVQEFVAESDNYNHIVHLIIIILGFAFFNLFYKISNQYRNKIGEDLLQKYNTERRYNSIFAKWGLITFVLGGISLIIFIVSFGGLSRILNIAEANRSFNVTLSEFGDYRFSLFSIPARIITVTPFIYAYLIINRKKHTDKLMFGISFVMSLIFYMFNAGRAPLLSFLLIFVYFMSRKMFKRAWVLILTASTFLLPVLDYLDNFFFYLTYGKWLEVKIDYIRYIYQFAFPYMSSLNIYEVTSLYGFRYGVDFITAFLNFIPGVNFSISYEILSQFYGGEAWRLIGGVPSDFLSFGYLQLSIVGVVIISSVAGYAIGKIDRGIALIPNNSSKHLIASILTVYSFFLIQSADFEPLLRGGVILLVTALIVMKISKTSVLIFKKGRNE